MRECLVCRADVSSPFGQWQLADPETGELVWPLCHRCFRPRYAMQGLIR